MLWITEEMISSARVVQVMDNHGNKHWSYVQGIPDILSTKSNIYMYIHSFSQTTYPSLYKFLQEICPCL